MRDAVRNEDFHKLVSLVNRGWEIKKALGSTVTNDKIEKIIKIARSSGAVAARLLGGGSQGFILLIAEDGKLRELQDRMVRLEITNLYG